MKLSPFVIFSIALACVAGCQNQTKLAENESSQPAVTSTDQSADLKPAPASKPDTTTDSKTKPPTQPAGSESKTTPAKDNPKNDPVAKKHGLIDRPLTKMPDSMKKALDAQEQLEKQTLQIPAAKTEEWQPSKVTLQQLAEAVQSSIPSLRNTYGHILVVVQTPDGTGYVNQELKLRSVDEYQVPFVLVGEQPADAKVMSNGKFKMEQVQSRWQKPVRASSALSVFLPTGMGAVFERDFSQHIFSPITKIGDSWPEIVQYLTNPSNGYTTTVEERAFKDTTNRYTLRQFRFYATRAGDAAKRLGKSQISMVIDGFHSLPVTIQTSYTDPSGKKTWNVTWSCTYKFSHQFADKDFAAPYTAHIKQNPPISS